MVVGQNPPNTLKKELFPICEAEEREDLAE